MGSAREKHRSASAPRRRRQRMSINTYLLLLCICSFVYNQLTDTLGSRKDEILEDTIKNKNNGVLMAYVEQMLNNGGARKDSMILPVNYDSIPFEFFGFPAQLKLPEQQLIVQGNETLEYWKRGGMIKLCHLLPKLQELNLKLLKLNSSRIEQLHQFIQQYEADNANYTFGGYNESFMVHIVEQLQRSDRRPPAPFFNFTYRLCGATDGGEGNVVTSVFLTRFAVVRHGVAFQWQCLEEETTRPYLLAPWYSGYYYEAPTNMTEYFAPADVPGYAESCRQFYGSARLDFMAKHIQQDTRRMAIALVGNRSKALVGGSTTQSSSFLSSIFQYQQQKHRLRPWYPNVELDDVVIHFRCGDNFGGHARWDYGVTQFTAYKQYISPAAKSVGILTQPFTSHDNRDRDKYFTARCGRVTHFLVDYLHSILGNDTRITIHNDPQKNETLPLAYARMVMANQSFMPLSTFSLFPTISTYGQGYMQKGTYLVNGFNIHLPKIMPHLQVMKSKYISARAIAVLLNKQGEENGLNYVMNWLINHTDPNANTTVLAYMEKLIFE